MRWYARWSIFLFLLLGMAMFAGAVPELAAQTDPAIEYGEWLRQMETIEQLSISIIRRLEVLSSVPPSSPPPPYDPELEREETELNKRLLYSRLLYSHAFPPEHISVVKAFQETQKRYQEARQKLRPDFGIPGAIPRHFFRPPRVPPNVDLVKPIASASVRQE